jgi:hypothetical protein
MPFTLWCHVKQGSVADARLRNNLRLPDPGRKFGGLFGIGIGAFSVDLPGRLSKPVLGRVLKQSGHKALQI